MIQYQWKNLTFWKSSEWKMIRTKLAGSGNIAPSARLIFRPLIVHNPGDIKVVIVGHEPYPYTGMAVQRDGFAYSVPTILAKKDGVSVYENTQQARLFKELIADTGISPPKHGSLIKWVRQGVMLWNFCLTGVPGTSGAHSHWGWDALSREVLEMVALENPKALFVPWGLPKVGSNSIRSIVPKYQPVYEGPSIEGIDDRAWYGSKPFTNINKALKAMDVNPIDWRVNF